MQGTNSINIRRDIATELHSQARRNYPRRCVIVKGFKDLFQADLVEMIPYSHQNCGYCYMLTVIDVFSKYAWARPLKRKNKECVTVAMRDILTSNDGKIFKPPRYLQTDRGTEFYNNVFQRMLEEEFGTTLYSVYSNLKASVVERFNRTLKSKMWREFSARGTYCWINMLPDLLIEYNSSKHRTIKMRPIDITIADEQKLLDIYDAKYFLHSRNMLPNSSSREKFKVGDCVRISHLKGVFEKGYTANWSSELFYIIKICPTSPITYEIRDFNNRNIEGKFYAEELLKVKHRDVFLVEKIIKRRGSYVLIKWLGFPTSENTWELASDILG